MDVKPDVAWSPITPPAVRDLLDAASFRWWISGGLALELHVGRSWRQHGDIDVSVCRTDMPSLAELLSGWELWSASGGSLSPLTTDQAPSVLVNNVWARPAASSQWALDISISAGDEHQWRYRRDLQISRPWSVAVLTSSDGIPYLAPELQLLFKSKRPRDKDVLDAETAIPRLELDRQLALGSLLPSGHPWQPRLRDHIRRSYRSQQQQRPT